MRFQSDDQAKRHPTRNDGARDHRWLRAVPASSSDLPEVLSGRRFNIDDPKAGRISCYADGPDPSATGVSNQPPVLLVHSINASASAHEVKPIYDALKLDRPTYALDLPGFGHSERSDRDYTQELMKDAILAVARRIGRNHQVGAIDALAVSLSSEFLAKAALERPALIRTLALVSPTGFARNASRKGRADEDCGRAGVLRFLKRPRVGKPLFRLLSSKWSIRFFLKKTWGRKEIDEEFFENSLRMAQHPHAHRAPFYFLSGFLFSANSAEAYARLQQPVWMPHGNRGDFNDYSRTEPIAGKPNWRITEYQTGALPYFEITERFVEDYVRFLVTGPSTSRTLS
jgi:pimeloyl-ACP methyl ester carboxylesterase